jgi:ketosteroid isomerase-like protein
MRPVLIFILIIGFPVFAQIPDSTSALFTLLNAERGFAQSSVMHGRNAAFVENFAEESVIFTDKWITNGKQFWKERKEAPVVLKWEPEFMDISKSGDFGISTGPWESGEYRPNTPPTGTGYFVSVWKKQSDGIWKVIFDTGCGTPPPDNNKHEISFPSGADKKAVNSKTIKPELVLVEITDAEKQMLTTWMSNPVSSTYASFLAPSSRIQTNEELPKTNKDSIDKWLSRLDKKLTWNSTGGDAASSGELGFTYGYVYLKGMSEKSTGHYVRIWKKQPNGKWTISLEMMSLD